MPGGPYNATFLKALACAIHRDKLDPAELKWFIDNEWSQGEIARELYKRVKN